MEVGGSPFRDVVPHGGGAQGFNGVGEHAQAVGIQRDEQEIEKEYEGGGAGQIGQQTSDTVSEVIGLGFALLLLVFMFGSVITAAVPLVSAIFSVGAGLSVVGLLASVSTFPTTAPTVATLLGLGVAVDYGLFLTARHREQLDGGMDVVTSASRAAGTSGSGRGCH